MTHRSTVLHDVALQPGPRRLQRNSPGQSAVAAAPLNAKITPSQATVVHIVDPAHGEISSASVNGALRQQVAATENDTNGFARGYQEGYQKAKQEANQEMQRMAEQLAGELAQEQVVTAYTRAKEESEQHSEQLRKKLHEQWRQKLKQLDLLLEQIPVQFHSYLADAEDDMLALVYEVVCRILGEEGASLPGLRAQLQQCMKAWHGHTLLNIELHPDDIALLHSDEECLKLLKTGGFSSDRSNLRWVADQKVSIGGCRLRSAEGALDARLEVQLKTLEATLLSTRASRKHLAMMERST